MKLGAPKIVLVCLEAIDNILNVGRHDVENRDKYHLMVEEAGLLDEMERLQTIENYPTQIYERCVDIIQMHFDGEEEIAEETQQETPEFGSENNHSNNNHNFLF